MDDVEWDKHMRYMAFQKIKYRKNVTRQERVWLADHPEQFDGIMWEHIARRRWHKVPLWKSQESWLKEHDGGAFSTTSSPSLVDRILREHQLEIQWDSNKRS